MGRPKKYKTDEERKAARREQQRRYYRKRKFQRMPENDIMNIGLNVLPGRISTPKELRLEAYDMIFKPSINLYTKRSIPKEIRDEAHNFIYDVLPVSRNKEPVIKTNRMQYINAKKQLGLAVRCIIDHELRRKLIRSFKIDWDEMEDEEREYLFSNLGAVIKRLCDIAELDSKWVVKYSFDDKSIKTRRLNFDTVPLMIRQLENEHFLDSITDEFSVFENEEYDFFPVEIRELKYLEFVDVSIRSKSKNKRNEAGFWRWILNLPLDLSMYQIFNALNERTVKLMTKDNCIIYSCIMAGISDDIINHMRDIFRNRFISINKIDVIGKECNIKFIIRYDIEERNKKVVEVGDKNGTEIKIVLVNQHYMIDKEIAISPYYIRHWREINKDVNAKRWDIKRRFLIGGISNGLYYVRQNSFDIVDVLKALFDIHAFTPITQSDIITYSSSLYKEKLDDITTLEYNPKFCCRLKEPIDKK